MVHGDVVSSRVKCHWPLRGFTRIQGLKGLMPFCDLCLVTSLAVISTASLWGAFGGPTPQHRVDPVWPRSLDNVGLGLSTFAREEKGWLLTLRVVLVTHFLTKKIRTKSDNKQKSTGNPIPLSDLNFSMPPWFGGQCSGLMVGLGICLRKSSSRREANASFRRITITSKVLAKRLPNCPLIFKCDKSQITHIWFNQT